MGNLGVVHLDLLRDARQHVATLHGVVVGRIVQLRDGGSHFNLDAFGGALAHDDVVLLAHVFLDVGGEVVARDADGFVVDDATQGDDGDFGGAATDVDDHVARRLQYVDADADGGGHRLMDQAHFLGAGLLSRVLHGAFLHLGDARRDADDHLQAGWKQVVLEIDHLDHLAHHVFGGLEVGDDTVAKRADGLDVFVGLAVHHHGTFADGDDLLRVALHGDDGRLVDYHLVVVYDNRVGRTEVNGDFLVQK